MTRQMLFIILCVNGFVALAQPYVDPFNFTCTRGFQNINSHGTPFTHLFIGPDLPFKQRNNGLFVISPVFENWNIDSASNKKYLPPVSSVALALSIVFPLDKNKWSLTTSVIPRFNSEGLKFDNSFQIGTVLLAAYKQKATRQYKFGIYINKEFFGLLVIPLAGIDWRINDRNYLFGVLPGRLTYEHKLRNNLYAGATFRAITNSYRLSNGNYLRIDDNRFSTFLDFYPGRHTVFSLEPGYGLFRKLRIGNGSNKNYLTDLSWNDGLFIKLSAAYRIRL